MISNLVLVILMHITFLERAASDGPCKVKLQLAVVRSPQGYSKELIRDLGKWFFTPENTVKFQSEYHIKRSDGTSAADKTNTKDAPSNKRSSCAANEDITDRIDPSFTDCLQGIQINLKGTQTNVRGRGSTTLWDKTTTFKCDGNEEIWCVDGGKGASKVSVTCTNEDRNYDKVFDNMVQEIGTLLDKGTNGLDDLNKYYFDNLAIVQERKAYNEEMTECNYSWLKPSDPKAPSPCRISFFKPIFGVIASYVPQKSEKLDGWTQESYMKKENWNEVHSGMATLMKKALNKERLPLDSNFFTRGMWYAQLHSVNSDTFPWNESPISKYTKTWFDYVKNGTFDDLQKLLSVPLDDKVTEFCNMERKISPFCSIISTMNNYTRALAYLPKDSEKKFISISASIAEENGLYARFNKELTQFLTTATIKEAINQLGKKMSEYFGTLASFDNQIAQADVGYLKTAIGRNNNKVTTNVEKMGDLVATLKKDQQTCHALKIFETSLNIVVGIAGCFAGGAGALTTIQSVRDLKGLGDSWKKTLSRGTALDAVVKGLQPIGTDAVGIVIGEKEQNVLNQHMDQVKGTVQVIITKLGNNSENIDDMGTIMRAIIDGTTLDNIKPVINKFLRKYSDYDPKVTKNDLTVLNTKYSDMLDKFEEAFGENTGILCGLFKGTAAKQKVREAKGIWASINTLLDDVHGQQFQLIDALVKAVRSRIDETAAKTIAPELGNDFPILVRHMLALRVAAQQVCDAYQLLKNDNPHRHCQAIKNSVFLSSTERANIQDIDGLLKGNLVRINHSVIPKTVYMPVTSEATGTQVINWDDLISGRVVEFAPNVTNTSFLKENRWNDHPEMMALLTSMELFIPNIKLARKTNEVASPRFSITAVQESVVVNNKIDTTRYTLKSRNPVSTRSWYTVDEVSCNVERNELFGADNGIYCISDVTGRFAPNMEPMLPVSMYSKFQIQLEKTDGYNREILRMFRPFGDTLKLPVRVRVYTDSAQVYTDSSRRRTGLRTGNSNQPSLPKYCRQEEMVSCKPCPDGSVPVAHGIFCISLQDANKIAEKLGTTVQKLNAE